MRKAACGAPDFGIFYVEKMFSPRPYTCFQVYALFRYGETTLSVCTY